MHFTRRDSRLSKIANGSEENLIDAIRHEQEYVAMLYGRLDNLREQTETGLSRRLVETGGTPQARTERDVAVRTYTERLAQFGAVENGLCFGRLDLDGGERRYIGRLGIFDEDNDYDPLLMDWRAPAARPFYLATAASRDGVVRRRHIRTRARRVIDIDDEVLDIAVADGAGREGLAGEAALLAALTASRTGRMSDIVETIQAEQDRVIRSTVAGVLVVQGGPGTGKTAVALHRAAYLLYTYRERLSRRGVLIVGPNATFLQYVSQVLPALGETGVLLSTVGELYPGVLGNAWERREAAEIKGRSAMVDLVRAAVLDREEVPDDALDIPFDREILHLDRATCERARERARASRRLHNHAQPIFVGEVIDALARQVADHLGADPFGGPNFLDEADVEDIRRELREDADVLAAIEGLWPVLTPQQLLTDLFASPARLATAAPWLSADERALLLRDAGAGWTAADVPLLDEAAELLGADDRAAEALAQRRRRERIHYAQGVLNILDLEDDADPEILMAYDLLDADQLAERHEDEETKTTAERAAADRTWMFGHVIVDEAQELSPMAWRLIMRRCPSRSMTLVGDVAQTGDLSGATSWQELLGPYVDDRWQLAELTVNYRTPAEIMAVAADVLAAVDPALRPPSSVRETGVPPWRERVDPGALARRLAALVAAEAAEVSDGRVGVLVPTALVDGLGAAIAAGLPGAAIGDHPELTSKVVVLTVRQAKGLEFDSVLVVDPERIMTESPRGLSDLYVALTRSTRRLGVLHPGELPPILARLATPTTIRG